MKTDALTPGEQWLLETLRDDANLRGWAIRHVAPDPATRGVYRIKLIDRYGREYEYRLTIALVG